MAPKKYFNEPEKNLNLYCENNTVSNTSRYEFVKWDYILIKRFVREFQSLTKILIYRILAIFFRAVNNK